MKPFHSPKIKFRNRVLKFLSPNFTENKSDRNCDGSISLKQIYKALKEPERFIVVQKGGEKRKVQLVPPPFSCVIYMMPVLGTIYRRGISTLVALAVASVHAVGNWLCWVLSEKPC